jgi:hypothetical protein
MVDKQQFYPSESITHYQYIELSMVLIWIRGFGMDTKMLVHTQLQNPTVDLDSVDLEG